MGGIGKCVGGRRQEGGRGGSKKVSVVQDDLNVIVAVEEDFTKQEQGS